MTGNINWAQTDRGIVWSFNTDGASIKFYNTGDGDTDSRLEFATSDNSDEYFRWGHIPSGGSFYESMRLRPIGSGSAELIVTGKIIKSGGTTSQFLKANGDVDSNSYYLASNPSAFITLTSLSNVAPIQYNNTTGAISITQASSSQNGFLSSTDWNTFNNKTSNVGTVTSVAALTIGTTGTDLSSSVANGTTTPVITLNVPTASASNRGALSAADWTTFNNKQNALTNPVTGTGTTNYLPKFTGASTIGDSIISESTSTIAINGTKKLFLRTNQSGVAGLLAGSALATEGNFSIYSDSGVAGEVLGMYYWNGSTYKSSLQVANVSSGNSNLILMKDGGNLGLGVTPSAWTVNAKVIDINTKGAFWSGSGVDAAITGNAYYDSVGAKYKTTAAATDYWQIAGEHRWFTAPSGTAGNAISFTQAMTLGSNSGLSIGTPSAAPSQGLLVQGATTLTGALNGTSATFTAAINPIILRSTNAFTMWTEYYYNTSTLSGYIGSGAGILSGANASDFIVRSEADFVVATSGNNRRLTIASTGAATFSSSVTANSLIIRNSGVPAAQFYRDLDVTVVGPAGQGIEFGARSGSTFIAGAAIYGGLDNPATTGNLVFQTLNGGTLGTRLTINSAGAATFSSSVTAGDNYLINNTTASKKGYTYQSPSSDWGPQVSGLYFNPNNAISATPTFTVNLWNGTFGTAGYGGFTDVLTINGAGGAATFSSSVTATSYSLGAGNGRFQTSGFWGTLITAGTGSFSNFAIIDSATNGIMYNPTGTLNMSFVGSVGIGTAVSNNTLNIYNDNNAGISLQSSFTGTTANDGFYIGQLFQSTNFLFRQRENADIIFETNNGSNQPLRITSGGNVLIGTTTDAGFKLDVNGTGRFSDGTQGLIIRAYTGADGWGAIYPVGVTPNTANYTLIAKSTNAVLNASTSVTLAVGDSGKLTANSTGISVTGAATFSSSVAINGSTSVDVLTVSRNVADNAGGITLYNAETSGYGSAITFRVNYAGVYNTSRIHGDWWLGNSGALHFFTANTSQSLVERMVIDGSGNVGIGTTSPVNYTNYRSLHISGSASNSSAILYLTNSTETIRGLFFTEGSAQRVTIGSQSDHAFTFITNDSERMRIFGGGNTHIGPTPASDNGARLQVSGASVSGFFTTSANNIAVFNSSNNDGGYITFRRGGNDFLYIGNSSAVGGGANNTDFYTTSGLGMRFFTSASGNIALRLDTSQNAFFGGNISATGDVIAFASSDRRLKDNLTRIESSLEKVGKLSGYSFDWNSNQESYSGKDYGVVAQEVEAIFPELVKTRDNGYKAVKYEKLIPVLIEAIKELNEKVEKLK
jgi:hypothetical protein